MSRTIDVRDCSRQLLESIALRVRTDISAGELGLEIWLAKVEAAIPDAPPYEIEHYDRRD